MAALIFIMALPIVIYIAWEVFDFTIKKVLGYSKATVTETNRS